MGLREGKCTLELEETYMNFQRANLSAIRSFASLLLWLSVCSSFAAANNPFTIENKDVRVDVDTSNGSYAVYSKDAARPVMRSRVSAEVDGHWLSSDQYPQHQAKVM